MKLGIVGWRGMVGSVLMDRMSAEKDFELVDTDVLQHVECRRRGARGAARAARR